MKIYTETCECTTPFVIAAENLVQGTFQRYHCHILNLHNGSMKFHRHWKL